MKVKLKKGDRVRVLSGKDKGKEGTIQRVLPEKGKVIVEGVNILKRHRKPRQAGQKGEIVEVASPLDISNVMIVCSKCSKPVRIAVIEGKDGKRQRACKKCKAILS